MPFTLFNMKYSHQENILLISRRCTTDVNNIQLLSFDEVNVWIYWLLKKMIFIEPKSEYHSFFRSQLIHTFTESKDSNCFILYFEEIVVFWKKKLHVHCPDVVLHYCMHHHCYLNLYHLIYFAMFRPTKWQILVLGTGGTSASTDHFLLLYWRMRQINYFFSLVD
jgi:hypothetical protein